MAAPTFGASGTYLDGDAATANVAVPSGVASGSVILVAMFLDGTVSVTAAPSGFTQAENSPIVHVAPGAHRFALYWKRATGSDTGTYNFTLSGSTYREVQAHRYESVVSSGTPFDSPTAWADPGDVNDTVSPAVSITTAGADRLLIHAATNWAGGTWTAPTGFTKRMQGAFGVVTLADKAQASAGSSGSITATCTGNDKRTAWLGGLIGTTAGGQSATANPALETDAAQALARTKAKTPGINTEADSAQPIGKAKARALGVVGETDAAQSLTRSKVKAIGTATETDTPLSLTRVKLRALGASTETDTSVPITSGGSVLIGTATETDTTQGFTRSKARTLGVTSETGEAQVLTRTKVKAIGTAIETDSTLTLTKVKLHTLGIATETGSILTLIRGKAKALGVASETDAAVALTVAGEVVKGSSTSTVTAPNTSTHSVSASASSSSTVT